jgi:CHAT domain-containing protein/tetratricopeptide (TPR) repeat protein
VPICLQAALALCLLFQNAPAPGWASFDQQAEALYDKGDLKEAVRVARLALEAATDTKQSAHSMDRLGFFAYTAGDRKEGESYLRQGLELRKSKLGTETADYAESANDLALFYRDTEKLPEARDLAAEAVAIRTRVLGPRDPHVAESLNTLGSILALIGDYDEAIHRLEAALDIHESACGATAVANCAALGEEYGTLCINLAGTLQRAGKYERAEALFEKGLAVLRVRPGINHPAYSASLVAYAFLQAELGHYSAAEKLYDESGKLILEQLGEQHPVYTAFLNNRAALYTSLGNLTVAEADYRKALDLKRKIYGPDAATVGASLRNLARLVSRRNPAEGEKLFQEAVDLYAKNPKAPPFDFTSALLGLAEAQRNRGDLAAARATLKHASDVAAAGLGTKHPLYAATLRDIGLVHQSAHEFAEAEKQLQQAVAIVEETQGPNHPDLAQYLERLAAVYDEAGDYRAAEPLYRRSLDIADRTLADMLTVGSERNKAAVLANLEDPVPVLLAFQRRAGDQLPAARALAFEAIARRQGRLLDEVHDWGRSLRDNPDDAIRTRFNQREAMLECQASLTIALGYRDLKPGVVGACGLPGTDLAGRYERLLHELRTSWTDALGKQALQAVGVLKQRIDALETALSRDVPQFASALRPVTLEDIRSHLQPDETLVEFVDYPDRDTRAQTRRYGAFLLARTGDLRWLDLGAASAIDRAVQDLIASANDWSLSLAAKEARGALASEATAQDALRALSEKLNPMMVALAQKKDAARLRIVPDGMLNLVPFGALQDSRGHFLIERFAISYSTAGRDLATALAAGHSAASSVVIAMSPGAGARRTVTAAAAPSAFRAERLERLEHAELEARDVKKWIPRAQLLDEGQATEQRIKQLHQPALLHIVGHGIVRGTEDCRANPDSPGCQLTGIDPAARVMSLSAIVLEEAYGRGGPSTQDGLLTALELQSLDLQGTEMLVLSQCRMADGVPSSGEGVFGMRRAAAIAGVKTFVAPLWKIADSTERSLMNRFYQELSTGKTRAEALRAAQLQLLKAAPTASFLQWAPVILSGDPEVLPKQLFAK